MVTSRPLAPAVSDDNESRQFPRNWNAAYGVFAAMAAAIRAPWKRPFSMKISLVCIPATSTPAR